MGPNCIRFSLTSLTLNQSEKRECTTTSSLHWYWQTFRAIWSHEKLRIHTLDSWLSKFWKSACKVQLAFQFGPKSTEIVCMAWLFDCPKVVFVSMKKVFLGRCWRCHWPVAPPPFQGDISHLSRIWQKSNSTTPLVNLFELFLGSNELPISFPFT